MSDRPAHSAEETEVTPEMIRAGVDALARSRRSGMGDSELVGAVYSVMAVKREKRVGEITREVVYNMRGVAEALEICERRLLSHYPDIMFAEIWGT